MNFFWGPFYVSTSYGLWTCEYQGVADKEVLSIVEMTQRSRAIGNQYGAWPLGFDWSLL